jgi:hypothetical protein
MHSRIKRLLQNDSNPLYSSPLCGIISNYIRLDKILSQSICCFLLPLPQALAEIVVAYSIPNAYQSVKFLSSEEKFVKETCDDLVYFQLTHYTNGFSKIKIRNTLEQDTKQFSEPDLWSMDIFPQKVLYLCYTNLVKSFLIFLSTDETNIDIWCNTQHSTTHTYKYRIFTFLKRLSKNTNSFHSKSTYKMEKLSNIYWNLDGQRVMQTVIDTCFDITIPAASNGCATRVEALHVSSRHDTDYAPKFLYYTVYYDTGNSTGWVTRNVVANNYITKSILYELCKRDELLSTELKLSISPFIYRIELMRLIEELWD